MAAQASHHHAQRISIKKKTVKVKSTVDEVEYPKAIKRDGKFILPWEATELQPDTLQNVRYSFRIDRTRVPNEKELDDEPLMEMMPADPERLKEPPENGIRTTWLGHASALFQLDNVNILVNPNFSSNPGNFTFVKRYREPVYKVGDLPRIDCAFITNTHYDYLDVSSVRDLNDRFGDMLLWYVPMGLGDWMHRNGCGSVVEMEWWKEDEVDFVDHTKLDEHAEEERKTTTFKIACTPSQSAHTRTFDHDNAVLWCSWVIASPRYNLFISGSTGYNEKIFKSIGRRYGPFHMAALPIGRYCPDWKFGFGNVTPEQAVQIQQDVLAMCALALSWGTISVSNEYYLEPPRRLKEELKNKSLSEMQFFLLKHGESRLIDIEKVKVEAGHGHHGSHAENHHHHHNHHDNQHANVNGHIHVGHVDTHAHGHVVEHAGHVTRTERHVETHTTHDGKVEITTTETVTSGDGEVHVTKHTETMEGGEVIIENGDAPHGGEHKGFLQRIKDKVSH